MNKTQRSNPCIYEYIFIMSHTRIWNTIIHEHEYSKDIILLNGIYFWYYVHAFE